MEEYGLAAFRSRQQVMRFEEALRREGIAVQVISTPRSVAVGCGLSVRFAAEDMPRVQSVLNRVRPGNLIGLYRAHQQGGRTLVSAVSRQFER